MDKPIKDAPPTDGNDDAPDDRRVLMLPLDLSAISDAALADLLLRAAHALNERGIPVRITSDVQTEQDAAGAQRLAEAMLFVRGLN